MSDEIDKLTSKKSVRRGRGDRMNAVERKQAQEAFLQAFAVHAIVSTSCQQAHISRTTLYAWLETDEDFSCAYNLAKEDAKDTLRAEIYRRAHDGWDEPLVSAGKFMGTVRKYSDTLLIFHSKALMAEYREKQQVEHSGAIDITGSKDQLLTKLSSMIRTVDETHEKHTTE